MAAAERATSWAPIEGDHGAKPMVVGSCSVRVQESATTAVATPFVVVSNLTVVGAYLVLESNDSIWWGRANMTKGVSAT